MYSYRTSLLIIIGLGVWLAACGGATEIGSIQQPTITPQPTSFASPSPPATSTVAPTRTLGPSTATATALPLPTTTPQPTTTPVNDWLLLDSSGPSPRSGMSFAYDSTQDRLILFGGTCSGYACADTWQYTSANGWQLVDTSGPSAREAAYMTYDSARQKVVLFGGHVWAGEHLDDTWEFDGSRWLQIQTATTPPHRSNQGIAFDETRQIVVMFGGWNDSQLDQDILGDTWEYDGTNWTSINTPIAPAARSNMQLVYAPNLGGVLLFGGIGRDAVHYNDTWLYNAQGWTQLQPTQSPPPRYGHQMAYHALHHTLILFGGTSFDATITFFTYADTWQFDGRTWSLATPAHFPPPTWNAGFAYYPPIVGILMFGGNSPHQNDLNQDLWAYNSPQ